MYAAPTAQHDLSILHKLHNLNWKQQMLFIQQLTTSLPSHSHPQSIQICFLGMLQQKNMNILTKIFKLIKSYIILYGINIVSYRQFITYMLSFSSAHLMVIQQILYQLINKSIITQQALQQLIKGIEDVGSSGVLYNFQLIVKIFNKILKINKYHRKIIESSVFQKCIGNGFVEINQNSIIGETYMMLFRNIVDVLGQNSILLGRKLKLPAVCIDKIKIYMQESNNQQYKQKYQNNISINSMNSAPSPPSTTSSSTSTSTSVSSPSSTQIQIQYIYDISSQQWLQDHKILSIKCISLSLKQSVHQSSTNLINIQLTQRLLLSLYWLCHRKNKNINKYIYQLITYSLTRSITHKHSNILIQILLQTLTDKRIYKKLKQQEYLTNKQQMWIQLVNQEYIIDKIKYNNCKSKCNQQQQYHQLIIFIDIIKGRKLMNVNKLCGELLAKGNLNKRYRILLEQIIKE